MEERVVKEELRCRMGASIHLGVDGPRRIGVGSIVRGLSPGVFGSGGRFVVSTVRFCVSGCKGRAFIVGGGRGRETRCVQSRSVSSVGRRIVRTTAGRTEGRIVELLNKIVSKVGINRPMVVRTTGDRTRRPARSIVSSMSITKLTVK